MKTFQLPNRQQGFSLIEVLVTMVILLIGLLGLAGLMVNTQKLDAESYQRRQALILLQDGVDRLLANPLAASCYVVTTDSAHGTPYIGAGTTLPTCSANTNSTLFTVNSTTGKLISGGTYATLQADGCRSEIDSTGYYSVKCYPSTTQVTQATNDLTAWQSSVAGAGETSGSSNIGGLIGARGCIESNGSGLYTISVAWQGLGALSAAPTSTCGLNAFGTETQRRVVSATVRVPDLNYDPNS